MDKKNILMKDLYAKFCEFSEHIRSLSINKEHMNDNLYSPEYEDLYCLFFHDEQIKNITKTIETIFNDAKLASDFMGKLFSRHFQGFYYEILTYSWLLNNNIKFTPEVQTTIGDTLSINNPTLDGLFKNSRVYFDIKTFEIPANLFIRIKKMLSEKFPKHNIMVGGSKDISYKDVENKIITNINNIIDNLKNQEQHDNNFMCYRDKTLDIDIELKLLEETGTIQSMISSFDPYTWAEKNEIFFLKNASQYTINRPFILLCPYRHGDLIQLDVKTVYTAFRSISRRAFCKLYKQVIFPSSYTEIVYKNGKIDSAKYTINEISTYLSGIIFIDISDICMKKNVFIFINPNAKNSLIYFPINTIFGYDLSCEFDNFINDNY